MFDDTRRLLRAHGGLILAGFLLFFFSVFGQSAFFGAYLPQIQDALGLSKTGTGALYAAATIASGFLIIFSGRGLDHYRLRHFLAFTLAGLAVGCFTLAAATGPVMLLVAFFLLRQFGQGLMIHSANTAVNRYLEQGRGKAMAMIGQGGPAHVVVFPAFALWLGHYVEWRTAWVFYGIFILAVLLPGFWFYLRRHQSTTHALWERRIKAQQEKAAANAEKEWTRRHVARDWRFYAIAMLFIIAPFVGTVLFLYQHDIAQALSITPLAYASSFPASAAAMVGFSFVAGYAIDRFGEKPVLIAIPLLYTAGILVMTAGLGMPGLYAGMILMGGAGAAVGTTGGPMIVHMYGTRHLGGIKAMLFSVNIIASAASPFIFGFLMDRGHDITTILSWCAFYTGVIWLVVFPVFATLKDKDIKAEVS